MTGFIVLFDIVYTAVVVLMNTIDVYTNVLQISNVNILQFVSLCDDL